MPDRYRDKRGRFISRETHLSNLLANLSLSDTMGENLNQARDGNPPMTLRDYMNPTRTSQRSCIQLPHSTAHFELKPSIIQMLPLFRRVENENPYHHVRDFEEICGTIRFPNMSDEIVKLRLFPFSLREKAKSWLY